MRKANSPRAAYTVPLREAAPTSGERIVTLLVEQNEHLKDIVTTLEALLLPVAATKYTARALRKHADRITRAKVACFARGFTVSEIEALNPYGTTQEGPPFAGLLEHLSKGKRITPARRKRTPSLVNPHAMRNSINEAPEPFEGVED